MKKIISLFQRNYDGDRLVRNEVVPNAEWVLAGEGIATRKFDGTCCLVRNGKLYKRHEVKPGGKPPLNFESANEVDKTTGKQQGWIPVGESNEDRWHREGFARLMASGLCIPDMEFTCELCGPKVQGNPENVENHTLIVHSGLKGEDCPRDFNGIKAWLAVRDIEGIVWHHPDGRMVKIKKKDFGLKRKPEAKNG